MKAGDWRINRSASMLPSGRRAYYEKIKSEVYVLLGSVCQACGFEDQRALQIDHVGGEGAKDRQKKSGTSWLLHVKKHHDSGLYQLLCANCNWIKRAVALEVPLKYPLNHKFPTCGNQQPPSGEP